MCTLWPVSTSAAGLTPASAAGLSTAAGAAAVVVIVVVGLAAGATLLSFFCFMN